MFKTDQQTLTDINALDWNSNSLLRFFDHTLTIGGRDELYGCLLRPLSDKDAIVDRQEAIAYLATLQLDKLFDKYMMVDLERYLQLPKKYYSESVLIYFVDKLSSNFFALHYKKERLFIRQSVKEIAMLLIAMHDLFTQSIQSQQRIGILTSYAQQFAVFWDDLDEQELRQLIKRKNPLRLVLKYDQLFRSPKKSVLQELFKMLYMLDALYAVAKMWNKGNLCFPHIHGNHGENALLSIKGMYNLALEKPVKNDVHIDAVQNIWFLTGANMTGKSTLLKSTACCVHLAHMGFPVPASSMEAVLFKGMMTSINLADSLSAGYSHFFAEVHRLKIMAEHIAAHGPMVIMLDEIFKGTNYQDAYEATLQLIDHISGINDCVFLISTHITDLGAVLRDNERIALKYIETLLDRDQDVSFTYKLVDGIAVEKLGMWILKREAVFESFRAIPSGTNRQ